MRQVLRRKENRGKRQVVMVIGYVCVLLDSRGREVSLIEWHLNSE